MTHILDEILAERRRQHELHGDQTHLPMGEVTTLDHQRLTTARRNHDHAVIDGTLTFRHILDEEFCEVLAAETIAEMRAELVQVAALCQQVLEAIDKGEQSHG